MNLADQFPQRFYMNLGPRDDRRSEVELTFFLHGLEVERMPAVKAAWVKDARGYSSTVRYACGITKALCVRQARLRGADAVLVFEDDLVLDDDFQRKVDALELPDDWGMFYFGCQHLERPQPVSAGLVRVGKALDTHAVAFRAPYFSQILKALRGTGKGKPVTKYASDVELSNLQKRIPTYAAFPNLAWQAVSPSDIQNRAYSNYGPRGQQLGRRELVQGLEWEMEHPGQRWSEARQRYGSVECIVVAWRPDNLVPILQALRAQTVPGRITVVVAGRMVDGSEVSEEALTLADRVFRCSENFGPYNRFLPGFMCETDYVYFHDDDMLPGRRMLEHFLEDAAMLGEFGVLSQEGRQLSADGGYNASAVPAADAPKKVALAVRGYFMPARHLPLVLQARWELGLRPQDDLEDDLILAYAMKRHGLACYIKSAHTDPETSVNRQELSSPGARHLQAGHYAKRDEFVRKYLGKA